MTGFDVINFVIKQSISIPVLIYTSYTEEDTLNVYKLINNSLVTIDFLKKPSKISDIILACNKLKHDHDCKVMKEVEIPELKMRVLDLEDEIDTMKDSTSKESISHYTYLAFVEMSKAFFEIIKNKNVQAVIGGISTVTLGIIMYFLTHS